MKPCVPITQIQQWTFPPASVRRNGPTALCKLEVPNVGDVIHHNVRYMLQKASQEKIS